jgi:hypothetical protein
VEILEFRFSKDDSCHKLGLRHPVYQIVEALGRLKPGQAVRVETDDFDWAQTVEIVARVTRCLGRGTTRRCCSYGGRVVRGRPPHAESRRG